MRARHDLGAGQRWLLACLCLLASLVYLARAPGPAGGTLVSPFQGRMVDTPGPPSADQRAEAALPTPHGMRGMTTGHAAEHHPHAAVPSAPDLTSAAPNAPPAGQTHQHAAHCPFCFTSAFALEADGVALLFSGGWRPGRTAPAHPQPALAPVRHADARAPPTARS